MHGKDFVRNTAMCFFVIVTCVNIVTYVLGSRFDAGATFGYEAFLSPIIFGLLGSIPNIVMYSKHELSVKEILIRKILQLILLEGFLYLLTFAGNTRMEQGRTVVLPFLIGVFCVFVAVHIISYLIDFGTAKTMTLDLEEFQKRNQ